jgi:hypothetical protein
MNLGGPVWHASVRSLRLVPERELARMAAKVLDGVGDRRRGEWAAHEGQFLHLRRRLSAAEEAVVGPVMDVRGADEARRRALAVPADFLALAPADIVDEELGDRP